MSETVAGITNALATAIRSKMDEINSQQVVFCTRGESLHNLNEAMLYVRNNEHTNRIKVVTVVQDEKEVPRDSSEIGSFSTRLIPRATSSS
ncbi:MAG TPA: hypothetical protein VLK65_16800 [Vicinamibacteria bacterium]|nr:hypothetical protein [Vicinamibacteria bacterium]